MTNKLISLALVVFVLFNFSVVAEAQQKQDNSDNLARIKEAVAKRGIGAKAKVKVKLRDGTEAKGYISQAGDDSFTVINPQTGQSHNLAYSDVRKVERPGWSMGRKIAIAVGVVAVVTVVAAAISIHNIEDNILRGPIGPLPSQE
jgi:hypothetical protein